MTISPVTVSSPVMIQYKSAYFALSVLVELGIGTALFMLPMIGWPIATT
jgi:hypothetical protein